MLRKRKAFLYKAACGTRALISGIDADWPNANSLPNETDGPLGFLTNAVNWTASGDGPGIAAVTYGGYFHARLDRDPDSFLAAELTARSSYFNGGKSAQMCFHEETAILGFYAVLKDAPAEVTLIVIALTALIANPIIGFRIATAASIAVGQIIGKIKNTIICKAWIPR